MLLSKWTVPVIALFMTIAGCNNRPANVPVDKAAAHTLDAPSTSMTGTWTGMFAPTGNANVFDKATGDSVAIQPTKITLFIDQMKDGQIYGYSVCAGNDRPFKGTYTEDGDNITAKLREPGDKPFDGVFDLVISKSPLSMTGTWAPLNAGPTPRRYTLARKNFIYDPSSGRYPESSTRLLTSDDVNNLLKDDLRYMRNVIYARHGYAFKLKEVRAWFDTEDWYMPVSTDVRKKLTSIEMKNEQLIKHFEQYADDSYDDYGR